MALNGKKVVVIDDDREIRVFYQQILSSMGIETHEAVNCRDGIFLLEKVCPHLVILDYHLDGEKGFNFLQEKSKKKKFGPIPVLMVSREKKRSLINKALTYGASGYLIKPIGPSQLKQKIAKMLKEFKYPSVKFDLESAPSMKIGFSGKVNSISEVSCQLASKVKLTEGAEIVLDSEILESVGVNSCKMKSTGKVRYLENNEYECEVSFVGVDEPMAKKIRQVQRMTGSEGD